MGGCCLTVYHAAGYTLALWMKIEMECSQPIAIVSTESRVGLIYQSGTLRFRFGTWRVVAEGVVVGRWHHVTVTWSKSSALSLYIDAIQVGRYDACLLNLLWFLADCICILTRSVIGYSHDDVVCLSVCPSVCYEVYCS